MFSLFNRWALKYGVVGLGSSSLITNALLNKHFRTLFNLNKIKSVQSNLSSVLLVCLMPTLTSVGYLLVNYMNDLKEVSNQQRECLICKETRRSLVYMSISTVFPTFLAWSTSYIHSGVYGTHPKTPNLSVLATRKNWLPYLRQSRRVFAESMRSSKTLVLSCFGAQFLLFSFISFMMEKQFAEFIQPAPFTKSEIDYVKSLKH